MAKAVEARIIKAQNTSEISNRRICRDKAVGPRVKIIPRDSLIRSTVIYGLCAKDFPRYMISRLGTYMYKKIRMATGPSWKAEAMYPGRSNSTKR